MGKVTCQHAMSVSMGLIEECPRCGVGRGNLENLFAAKRLMVLPRDQAFKEPWRALLAPTNGTERGKRGESPVEGRGARLRQSFQFGHRVRAVCDLFRLVSDERVVAGTIGHVCGTEIYGCPLLVSVEWNEMCADVGPCPIDLLEVHRYPGEPCP